MELLEDIIDELIEYDNGGSQEYSTADIATKCFELRKQIKEMELKSDLLDKFFSISDVYQTIDNINNFVKCAEVGSATIKVFENGFLMTEPIAEISATGYCEIETINDLLRLAKELEKDEGNL